MYNVQSPSYPKLSPNESDPSLHEKSTMPNLTGLPKIEIRNWKMDVKIRKTKRIMVNE